MGTVANRGCWGRVETLTLRKGGIEVDVRPGLGGAIVGFRLADGDTAVDVFRPTAAGALASGDILATSCFPLVPYSGRIKAARLAFQGAEFSVPRTVETEPNALHGDGWMSPWAVDRAGATALSMSLHGDGGAWPFPYRAELRFSVTDQALEAELRLTNTGPRDMPAGLGLHPWFGSTHGVRMQTDADKVWLIDRDNLFDRVAAVPDKWDFRRARDLAGTDLCHGLTGWRGRAVLEWPELGLRLTMTANDVLGHLVVYTPPGESFFCVEPVSHSVDGFNLAEAGVPDTGTAVLAPGESLVGRACFAPEGIR